MTEQTAAGMTTVSLTGTEWQLMELTVDGHLVDIDGTDGVLRLDGKGGFSSDGCNLIEGTAEVEDATIVLDPGFSTAMFCEGPRAAIDDAIGSLAGIPLDWSITDNRLQISADDTTVLVYQVRESIYPDLDARAIIAGERDGVQYRLAVAGADGADGADAMLLESRQAAGLPWDMQAFGAPSPGESPMWSLAVRVIGDQTLIGGFVPVGTARATHQVDAESPAVELVLHDVGDPDLLVAAGWVPDHSAESIVIAYDEAGAVLAEWPQVR